MTKDHLASFAGYALARIISIEATPPECCGLEVLDGVFEKWNKLDALIFGYQLMFGRM